MTHSPATTAIFGLSPLLVSLTIFVLTYAVIVTEKINRSVVALLGAGLMLLARVVREMTAGNGSSRGVYWSAVLGASALAVSPTFWVQATTANIRSLTGLFTAAFRLLSMRYVQERSKRRLASLAFVFGLGVGHHSSLVLLALPVFLYLIVSDTLLLKQPRRWLPAAGGETAYITHSAGRQILDVGRHLTLPLATLFLAYLPGNFLLTRGSMVMVLKEQFIETARAKGLPPLRIRYAHAIWHGFVAAGTSFHFFAVLNYAA